LILSKPKIPAKPTAVSGLAAGAVMISFSGVFVKLAHVGPIASGFYRMLFGAMALFLVSLMMQGRLDFDRRSMGWAALAGLLFAADLSVWHRSILYVGPGLATVLANFQVFVMIGVGMLYLGERPGWRIWLAVVLAILGLMLLVGPGWNELSPQWRSGVLLGLATALFYAGYMLTLRPLQRGRNGITQVLNIAQAAAWTALFLCMEALLRGESLTIPDGLSWGVLLAYGVLCQALGWFLISLNLPLVAVSVAGIIILLQPVLAFVWDIWLFDRVTTLLDLIGALMVVVAIYIGVTRQAKGK